MPSRARPSAADLEQARQFLAPAQARLFSRMQLSEQAHALAAFKRLRLRLQGAEQPDLLTAALLHDVGKVRLPLQAWERVLIVLTKALAPGLARRWGAGAPETSPGWRRAFLAAEQHPAWGAEMARGAGVSPLAEALIRRHQEKPSPQSDAAEDVLLRRLQAVDDES